MPFEFPKDHMAFMENALAGQDALLAKKPGDLGATYNKALMLLSIGRFEEGWPLFESRLKITDAIFSYDWFPVRRWEGENIAGKSVLLWLEQGVGDQVMAASMLPDLIAKGCDITVLADGRFAPLFRRSFPQITFYKTGDRVPERLRNWSFDVQFSVSDIGYIFRKDFDDFPRTAYIKPDPNKVAKLRAAYKTDSRPVIGFSWMSAELKRGVLKSIPPQLFGALLQHDNCKYVNLQYGDNDADMSVFDAMGCNYIVDRSIDPLLSLDDCAAQIAACDMVVSSSNSTVHLAGAMGVETSVIVPIGHGRAWYWFTSMRDSPWYPSLKIHRCPKIDQWEVPIVEAKLDLQAFACKFAPEVEKVKVCEIGGTTGYRLQHAY